jgi:hypothetical protein
MMHDITKPLILSRGNHKAGSGRGCGMNVISWEQGEDPISDYPGGVCTLLAGVVQSVNDAICTHTTNFRYVTSPFMAFSAGAGGELCPECSAVVLDLAHRVVGSAAPCGCDTPRFLMGVQFAMHSPVTHRAVETFTVPHEREQRRRLGELVVRQFEVFHNWKAGAVAPEVTARAVERMLQAV